MRLKLLLIASLLAAIIGAGASIAIVYWILGSQVFWMDPQVSRKGPGWLVILVQVPTILLAMAASFFVYRHNARRRKLQAALTFVLTLVLSVAVHIAAHFIIHR